MEVFRDFTVHATAVKWGKANVLTLELQFANTADRPLALSNSGSGLLYTVTAAVTGRGGRRQAAAETTGALAAPFVHTELKPAETRQAKLIFKIPRGPSTLRLQRESVSQAIGVDRGHLVAECTIAG
jgi:hypothetical protein